MRLRCQCGFDSQPRTQRSFRSTPMFVIWGLISIISSPNLENTDVHKPVLVFNLAATRKNCPPANAQMSRESSGAGTARPSADWLVLRCAEQRAGPVSTGGGGIAKVTGVVGGRGRRWPVGFSHRTDNDPNRRRIKQAKGRVVQVRR